MAISIRSRSRVFPESHVLSAQPKVKSLSVIDATVLHFSKSACVWFYDDPLDIDLLTTSLRKTLDAYPQWVGQLRFAEYDRDAGHAHRQGRLELSYGSPSDPGVECILAEADLPKSSLFPPNETADCWDATHVGYRGFLDAETKFALHDSKEHDGLPSMKVQFTTFKDDNSAVAVAVAVSIVHSLADAAALLTFTKDWAATNRALSSSKPVPDLQPLFNPSLIDAAAAGDIDAQHPDPSILHVAAQLPVHRFDYWASAGPSTPPWSLPLTEIPRELASHRQDIDLGNPVPYHTWDTTAPVSHARFFFSPAETHAIYLRAAEDSETRISHQDALLAHLWAALIRARGLKEGEEHFLDISLDGRRRLETPLPPAFIGSPIFNAGVSTRVTATTSTASGVKDLSDKAAAIRNTVARFDGENSAALLHEMCFE